MNPYPESEIDGVIECARRGEGAEKTANLAYDIFEGHGYQSFCDSPAIRYFVADAYNHPKKYADGRFSSCEVLSDAAENFETLPYGTIITAAFWGDLAVIDFESIDRLCREVALARLNKPAKEKGPTWKNLKLRNRRH